MNRFFLSVILTIILYRFIYPQQIFYPDQNWQVDIMKGCYNLETADVNRDGHLDIISGNFNDTWVYFDGPKILDNTVDLIYKGRCIAITDFNGDGIPDMITMHFTNINPINNDYDGEFLFYYGKKTGTYLFDTIPNYSIPLPTLYPNQEYLAVGTGKTGVRTGDFNKDGKMDIVISAYNWPNGMTNGRIYIYLGNTIPSNKPDYTIDNNILFFDQFASYFEVGDINGDGYDDLLISQNVYTRTIPRVDSLHNLYIFYGSTNTTFDINNPSLKYESHVNIKKKTSDWFMMYFSIDDINGDGIKDLVVSTSSSTNIHYGKIGGIDTIPSIILKFFDPIDSSIMGRGTSQDIGDYNNDGYHDFILSGAGKTFWLILGGPKVSSKNPYGIRGLLDALYFFPNRAVNVGDQTGDGVSDFVCSSFGGSYGYGHLLGFYGNKYIVTDIKNETQPVTGKAEILQTFPNPFNSQMKISYTLTNNEHVMLKLYNSIGQEIEQLKNETENPGIHEVSFNNDKLPSGIYFLTLIHGGETITKKIALTK